MSKHSVELRAMTVKNPESNGLCKRIHQGMVNVLQVKMGTGEINIYPLLGSKKCETSRSICKNLIYILCNIKLTYTMIDYENIMTRHILYHVFGDFYFFWIFH